MRCGFGLYEACGALLAGAVVAACSSGGLSAKPMEGAVGGDDGPGTPGFEQGADAAAGSLTVSLSASATTSCPGQCVELTPQIRGGTAPYTVRWSDGSTSGAAAREVCPTATTTYTAMVTDSSGQGGELARADLQAQAGVKVTVTPACAGDGGSSQAHEICSQSWIVRADNWGPPEGDGVRVAVDGVGDQYVAVTFTGTLVVAGQNFQSSDGYSLVVVKMDPACRVLWARMFGGPRATVRLDGVAADATGNVIVAGTLWSDSSALVDFGSGPIGNSSSSSASAVVFKLGPDGKGLWSHAYLASSALSAVDDIMMMDVAVDARGNTVFLAAMTAGTSVSPSIDFGGGAVGFSWSVVELDANGKFVLNADASAITGAAGTFEPYTVATDSAGRIRVAGCEGGASCQFEIVALDAGAHPQWVRKVSAPAYKNLWLSPVRVGANDEVLAATTWTEAADGGWLYGRWLNKFSAGGSPSWTPPATIPEPAAFDDSSALGEPGRLAVDPSGRALFASTFSGSADFGSAGPLTSAGGLDSAVLRFDGEGRLVGTGRWGGTSDELLFDVASDVAGNAVIAGRTLLPAPSDGGVSYAIFVAKLGW